ncbi:MAG TPA: CAP domain-containing protein [Anaerolineales bacterium]|nr:CAP domain-containing protein [Anaerolineales bacterium]
MPKHRLLCAWMLILTLMPVQVSATQNPRALSSTRQPAAPDAVAQPGEINPLQTGCGGSKTPIVDEAFEQRVVELVNRERTNRGLPPLKRSDHLDEAARFHAADLAKDNYFEHDTYDREGGQLNWVCNTWDRIGSYYSGARGENIAAGYSSPEDVVAGWMESPGHRGNMLSESSWEIGVGFYAGEGDYYFYWVQDFGMQDGVYPLIIDGEAAASEDPALRLYIYGDWQQLRLRNDGGAWSDWQPFQTSVDWILTGGVGEHTVEAELRSGSTAVISSDTIYLSKAFYPSAAYTVYLPGIVK